MPVEPHPLFRQWYDTARRCGLFLAEAMCFSTVSQDGKPSSRMVLMKGCDESGIVFYTNNDSRKGVDMEHNRHVSVVFHWNNLLRQIRIEGVVDIMSDEKTGPYFHSRPRGSQIGAWVSKQSAVLLSRDELEKRTKTFNEKYKDKEIPLPPNWKGYCIEPTYYEFWQARANRLHDRICYEKEGNRWKQYRLYP